MEWGVVEVGEGGSGGVWGEGEGEEMDAHLGGWVRAQGGGKGYVDFDVGRRGRKGL